MVRKVAAGAGLLDRLLLPLDGTTVSEHMLARVAPLARAAGSEVVLLQVVPFMETLIGMPVARADTSGAWAYVEAMAAKLRGEGVDAHGVAAMGAPGTTILEVARMEKATLIAMGTHARAGLRRLAFGSVSSKVLRHALLPVLLAHPPGRGERGAPAAPTGTWVLALPELPRGSMDRFAHVVQGARRVGAKLSLVRASKETEIVSAADGEDAGLVLLPRRDPRTMEELVQEVPQPLLFLPVEKT